MPLLLLASVTPAEYDFFQLRRSGVHVIGQNIYLPPGLFSLSTLYVQCSWKNYLILLGPLNGYLTYFLIFID